MDYINIMDYNNAMGYIKFCFINNIFPVTQMKKGSKQARKKEIYISRRGSIDNILLIIFLHLSTSNCISLKKGQPLNSKEK